MVNAGEHLQCVLDLGLDFGNTFFCPPYLISLLLLALIRLVIRLRLEPPPPPPPSMTLPCRSFFGCGGPFVSISGWIILATVLNIFCMDTKQWLFSGNLV